MKAIYNSNAKCFHCPKCDAVISRGLGACEACGFELDEEVPLPTIKVAVVSCDIKMSEETKARMNEEVAITRLPPETQDLIARSQRIINRQ